MPDCYKYEVPAPVPNDLPNASGVKHLTQPYENWSGKLVVDCIVETGSAGELAVMVHGGTTDGIKL